MIEWTNAHVIFTIDDQVAIRYRRTDTSAWPTGLDGGLPVRIGPWVPAGEWSGGAAQWPASESSDMTVQSLSVETCPSSQSSRSMSRKPRQTAQRGNGSGQSSAASMPASASRSIGLLALAASLALRRL